MQSSVKFTSEVMNNNFLSLRIWSSLKNLDHTTMFPVQNRLCTTHVVWSSCHLKSWTSFSLSEIGKKYTSYQVHQETANKQQTCTASSSRDSPQATELQFTTFFYLWFPSIWETKTMWETREKNLASHPRIEKSSYSPLWQPKQR
jgi:hypothetical protein